MKACGTKTFDEVEAELLNGQKIQGTGTAQEVMTILKKEGKEGEYPLLTSIYKISFEVQAWFYTFAMSLHCTLLQCLAIANKIISSLARFC